MHNVDIRLGPDRFFVDGVTSLDESSFLRLFERWLNVRDAINGKTGDRIFEALSFINRKQDYLMSTVNEVKTLVTAIDTETTAVATKVDAQIQQIAELKAQIAAGSPVTQEDLDAIAAGLQPISDRLTAIGADPANPIPPAA